MRNSLKPTIAGALMAGSVGLASAADLGRAPVAPARAPVVAPAPFYNWTGFYVGVQGGFGWADLERTFVTTGVTLTHEVSGGLIGGTLGYNWQFGAWVIGFEADYAWADLSRSVDTCAGILLVTCRAGLDTFGTARLRVGGAWGPALIYATGGLAGGRHLARVEDNLTGASAELSQNALGWTVGGGVEWGFYPGWSLKAEALYFDVDVDRFSTVNNFVFVDPAGFDHRLTGVVVRGGINYRFNWGGPPVVASY